MYLSKIITQHAVLFTIYVVLSIAEPTCQQDTNIYPSKLMETINASSRGEEKILLDGPSFVEQKLAFTSVIDRSLHIRGGDATHLYTAREFHSGVLIEFVDVAPTIYLSDIVLTNVSPQGAVGIVVTNSRVVLSNIVFNDFHVGVVVRGAGYVRAQNLTFKRCVTAMSVKEKSYLQAPGIMVEGKFGTSQVGVEAFGGSTVEIPNIEVSNVKYPITSQTHAIVNAERALARLNVDVGFQATHGGTILCPHCRCEECNIGVQAKHQAHITCTYAQVSGPQQFAYYAGWLSDLSCREAIYSSARSTAIGFFAEFGSMIDAKGAACETDCGSTTAYSTTNSIVDAQDK